MVFCPQEVERSPGGSHVGPEGRQHQAPGCRGGDSLTPGADAQGEPDAWSAWGAWNILERPGMT